MLREIWKRKLLLQTKFQQTFISSNILTFSIYTFLPFLLLPLTDWECVSFKTLLHSGNWQISHRPRSGECGGCLSAEMRWFAENSMNHYTLGLLCITLLLSLFRNPLNHDKTPNIDLDHLTLRFCISSKKIFYWLRLSKYSDIKKKYFLL